MQQHGDMVAMICRKQNQAKLRKTCETLEILLVKIGVKQGTEHTHIRILAYIQSFIHTNTH